MKFGGSSVADTEKIKEVARRLVRAHEQGERVVGVLSAMGDTTDELIRLAHEISPSPHPREYDMLISVGERISNSLCAMAVQDLGHEAISLTGSQAGIVTDTVHGKAKISEMRATRINDALDAGKIVLVAGFQGVSADSHDVTTLGRGGSNLTAVALAAALGASACEMYTDVEGVYTADPRLVPNARKLDAGDVRGDARARGERRESAPATLGRVRAQPRCAAAGAVDVLRRRGNVDRRRRGSRARESDHQRRRAHGLRAPLPRPPDRPGAAVRRLAEANVNVDTILQVSTDEIVFSAPVEDRRRVRGAARRARRRVVDARRPRQGSLVGAGMKSHPGIAAKTFATLDEHRRPAGGHLHLADQDRVPRPHRDVPKAVAALHDAFELGAA